MTMYTYQDLAFISRQISVKRLFLKVGRPWMQKQKKIFFIHLTSVKRLHIETSMDAKAKAKNKKKEKKEKLKNIFFSIYFNLEHELFE